MIRWMKTGDIGHMTEDGTVFISDRLKELIKVKQFKLIKLIKLVKVKQLLHFIVFILLQVKGLQVAPAELEDCLRSLQGVRSIITDPILRAPVLWQLLECFY